MRRVQRDKHFAESVIFEYLERGYADGGLNAPHQWQYCLMARSKPYFDYLSLLSLTFAESIAIVKHVIARYS